ncbi:peptide chain release factor-like protein [Proteus mirabilis]|nr:peptide chain release factor-like protein [Proteus mirabilis]WFC30593.1 peptide chain release factor-like protein [Proteus mirabilis]
MSAEELDAANVEVAIAGRMMTRRIMGKASFATLQDMGGRIQLYVSRDDLPEGVYNEQFKKWDIDIEINPADLRIDVYRASGAGGQHVNKTESAVRITHVPTGLVTQCQNDRSQHKNKDQAMKQMKAKLYELEMQKKNADKQVMEDNKSDIGWGSQIRSYVLDDSRIKDLRTGVETRNTQAVLDGDLDKFIEASLKAGL